MYTSPNISYIIAQILRTFHLNFPLLGYSPSSNSFLFSFIFYILHMKKCYGCFLVERLLKFLTLFYWEEEGRGRGGGRVKMPYPSGGFEISPKLRTKLTWSLNFCLKAVLKKLLKIGVRKALKHALSWMTSYGKKSPKIFFRFFFFSIIFYFLSFPCCVC